MLNKLVLSKEMKNIAKKILLTITILFLPSLLHAQIIITEIMYDLSGSDTDREWVEIYNSGSEPINILTGTSKGSWRFVINSAHTLNLFQGDETIGSGEYAIISKKGEQFLSEWQYAGTIFSSAISLPNTTATLSIRDGDGNTLDQVSYSSDQGANGDGLSLQKSESGSWFAGTPTPGKKNESSSGEVLSLTTAGTQTSNTTSGTTGGSSSLSTVSTASSQLEVVSGSDRFINLGSPINFQAVVKKNTVPNSRIDFNWSFGDGNVGVGQSVNHTYKYPGEYAVVLNARAGDVYSVSRFKVRVGDVNISLTLGDEYIEIFNNSKSELNLFNWKISHNHKAFIFQSDTIVLPNSKLTLDKSMLSIKGEQTNGETILRDSRGKVVVKIVDPLPSVPMSDIQKQADDIWNEVSLVVDRAISAKLVTEKNPPILAVSNKPNTQIGISNSETNINPKAEVLGDAYTEDNQDEIIYEAPKKKGLVNNFFGFFADLFR